MTKNSYPEKPIVPYKKTTVNITEVNSFIDTLQVPREVKRATYILFRIESQNGQKGINNNYAGIQADSGRWAAKFDSQIVGTVELKENKTGYLRRFIAFSDFKASVEFLADRVQARGLYIGGTTHKITQIQVTDKETLSRVYLKEWVKGDPHAEPTPEEKTNFLSIYQQAAIRFI